ncbi:ABC transporter ATP-binding protein [Lachnospiraceae bacterium 38-10]
MEVKNLTKRYGKHTAVDGLSFSVESGQIYGFLGPNGAGKSTTMNIMTGYLASSGGEVLINGHDMMREPAEAKKCIGYLPEVPPVYPDMTVREYLQFAAELKGILKKERKQQIAEVMELTKVTEVSERLIKNLSKGYRQRVGLAQAILGEPDVIILDEPMVGLDPRQIIEMRDLIRDLGKKHTVILSSHILSEVSAVCDHIMIISDGRLVASDSPEGLQRLIQGSSSLEAVVKATMQQIREVIDTIEAVVGMEEKPSHMPDCVTVSIRTKDNADIREELSMKLYERKLPIMGMSLQEHSLEDIFLELTERQEEDAKADNKEEDKHDSDI